MMDGKNGMPDMPREGGNAQGPGRLSLYPAAYGWMRALRITGAVAFLLPVAGMMIAWTAALSFSWSEAATPAFFGAMLGALAAIPAELFVCMASLRQIRAEEFVMVQNGYGALWQVHLYSLNQIEAYRFAKRSPRQTFTWDYLVTQERQDAANAVFRAVSDLTGGRTPSAALQKCITPLYGVALLSENAWSWKVSYQSGGRTKRMSLPKAYPGLRPTPQAGTADGPVPFKWSLCLAAALTAAACIVLGGGIAYGIAGLGRAISDGQGYAAKSRDPVKALEPADTTEHFLGGVSYRIDSSFQERKEHTYYDEERETYYTVMALRGAGEKEALDFLLEDIGTFRKDEDFDHFVIDQRGEEDLTPFRAANGETFLYNLATVYLKDGRAYHTAVALSDEHVLIVVKSSHRERKQEEAAKGNILYILGSLSTKGDGAAPPYPAGRS